MQQRLNQLLINIIFCVYIFYLWGFPGASAVKNVPAKAGDTEDVGLIPGSGRCPGEGNGNPLQYSCLGKSHGQRSLAGYSPLGHKELDMTEQLSLSPWSVTHQAPSFHGISQARILEWVAISFSRGSSRPRDQTRVSCIGRLILYHLSHQSL